MSDEPVESVDMNFTLNPQLVMLDASFRALGYKTHDDPKPDLFAMIKAESMSEAVFILSEMPDKVVDYPKIVIERMA